MTTNTRWHEVSTYQNNPHDAINAQRGTLDASISEEYQLVGDTSPTLNAREFSKCMVITTDATQTAAQTITIPSDIKKTFVVHNSSSHALTIMEGSSTVVVPSGDRAACYTTGEANSIKRLFFISTAPLTITARSFFQSADTAQTVYIRVMDRSQTLLSVANGLEAQMACTVSPDAATNFDIRKNGVQVGTIQILAAATTGTFTVSSDVSFAIGDRLSIVVTTTNAVGKNYTAAIQLT